MSPEIHDEFEWDELPALFPDFEDPGRWLPLLRRHLALVEEAAPQTRVTSVPGREAVRRHYAESLELLRVAYSRARPGSIVDVGSGGGYPGMVIAAVLPGTPVSLVEPLQKRARLLEAMAVELGLRNVGVFPLRAEEAGRTTLRDSAELVTARAVAPLAELLEYTVPLARVEGEVVLAKGSSLPVEIEEAKGAMGELKCALIATERARPSISSTLVFATFRKSAATTEKYPRRPGVPGKRPLQNG